MHISKPRTPCNLSIIGCCSPQLVPYRAAYLNSTDQPNSDFSGQRRWLRIPSPLARGCAIAYVVLLVDATLSPWTGWRDRGIGPFDYLIAPWPSYVTFFDVVLNVLGYVPLGLLLVFSLYPRIRGSVAITGASLVCLALSSILEAIQTFFPVRVAAVSDLGANALGGLLGASLGQVLIGPLLERGWLRALRWRWFRRGATAGLLICLFWILALVYPDPYAFGSGGLLRDWLRPLLDSWGAALWWQPHPRQIFVGEALVAFFSVLGAGVVYWSTLRLHAPVIRLVLAFLGISIAVQTLAARLSGIFVQPLVWLTSGTRLGLVMAVIVLVGVGRMQPSWRATLGIVALIATILLATFLPQNPYYVLVGNVWAHPPFLNLHGLTTLVHQIWPFVALLFLVWGLWSERSRRRLL